MPNTSFPRTAPRLSPHRKRQRSQGTRNLLFERLEARALLAADILGEWGPLLNWGVQAKHMVVLPTGNVLVWSTGENARVWDTSTDASFTPTPFNGGDLHCAAQATLADGRVIVLGGQDVSPHVGTQTTAMFDPFTNTWTEGSPMNEARWYATATALADGRVLVSSGDDHSQQRVTVPEVYDPQTDTWTLLTGADRDQGLYPFVFVLPNGLVFDAGPKPTSWSLDLSAEGKWIQGPTNSFGNAGYSESAAMYRPGKVLRAGGGDPAIADAAIIDMTQQDPAWKKIDSMAFARRRMDLTILADGTVMAVGGTGQSDNVSDAVLAAEIWNPDTEKWTTVAAMAEPRMYHSATVLLPDGRVVVGGGEAAGRQRAQIYSPPYLFQGPRPTISSSPATATYGSRFEIDTPEAASIASVALLRGSAVTHAFDHNQRYVPLDFEISGGKLLVNAPPDGNTAPPGYYMLVIKDTNGVPSIASWVRVDTANNLLPGNIAGTVIDAESGVPIAGAIVSSIHDSVTTDASGNYLLADLPSGEHLISVSAPGYALSSESQAVLPTETATLNFALIEPGELAGTVRELETGAVIAGAKISYLGGSTTTDANGNYLASGVPSGSQELIVTALGRESIEQTVHIPPHGRIDLDFLLPRGETVIEGEVFDATTSVPIEGATVSYQGRSVVTDEFGFYEHDDVDAGTYLVTVSAPGYVSASTTVIVATGFEATADFALEPARAPALTFVPTDDAHVKSSTPRDNYGSLDNLRIKQDTISYRSYLKFDVHDLVGAVASAKLRLFVTEAGHSGGAVYSVGNNLLASSTPWTENNLTWNTAPALSGTPIASTGRVNLGTWVEFDVTSAITGNGDFSFAIQGLSTGSVLYSSKEGAEPPQLVVETTGLIYRTINGSGNHPDHPLEGAAETDFIRFGYPGAYPDGHGDQIDDPGRPNPRDISNRLNAQPGRIVNDRLLTDWVVQWGQFISHDLSLTTSSPESNVLSDGTTGDFNIPITSPLDPLGPNPIRFNRSDFNPDTGTPEDLEDGRPNWREQINHITSFLDGSQIYGSDDARAAALRTFEDGKLRTSENGLLPRNTDHWPNDDPFRLGASLFLAGDVRANEQVGLTAVQILFVREHNRLAERIKAEDPNLDDEQIYQLARKIVGAELQIITYKEYLPAVFGNAAPDPAIANFDHAVDASITNAFATSMFRFGHSMQSPDIRLVDDNGSTVGSLSLKDSFFDPAILGDDPQKVDLVLKGLASQFAQENDPYVVDELRNFLFGPPGAGGMDLAALDIQRGRDHGLPDFNSLREAYGLARVTSFSQISSRPEVQAALQELYGNVGNIDAWVGAIAEDHLPGSSAGRTITEVVVNQFVRLRDGDRLFYVNDPLLKTALVNHVIDLQQVTLAEVIRDNTGITNIQDNVFFKELTAPQIASFAPTSGPAGAEVTLQGSGFDSITAVEMNGVPLASWSVDSDTQIRIRIPAAGSSGPIAVTYPAGEVASAGTFTVTASSTIHFPADGGTYNAAGWTGSISGSFAGDDGGSVQVSVRRLSDGMYWSGSAFDQDSEKLHSVVGTTNWNLGFPSAQLADGVGYAIKAIAKDTSGNTQSTTTATFTFDSTPPKLASFTRQTPAICSTDDDVLVFRATFNESVKNVDAGDFVVKGTTASVANVSFVDPGIYQITVSGGNLANMNGTVGLELARSQVITDLAGNVLPVTAAITNEQFIVTNSQSSIVVLFQDGMNGYQGTRDTTIFGDFPNEARFGSSPKLELDGNPDQISLIRWDTAVIPRTSTVSAVSITYNVVNASVGEYQVYQARRPWDEQTATYLLAASGQPWGAPGAAGTTDRGSAVLGEFKGPLLGLVTIDLNAAGVAMVQEWITNPADNFGIVVQNLVDSNDDDLDFSSREAGRVLIRPRLIVEFLPGVEQGTQLALATSAMESHNYRNPYDVNDDSAVTPLDALNVINELNRPAEFSGEGEDCVGKIHKYTDVSGDNQVTPTDVLLIFNYLNRPLVDDNEDDLAAGEGQLPEGEAAPASTSTLIHVGPVTFDVAIPCPGELPSANQPVARQGSNECALSELNHSGTPGDSAGDAADIEELLGDTSIIGRFLNRESLDLEDLTELNGALESLLREPHDTIFSNWLS